MILFQGENCSTDAPVLFFWLVVQIAIFYFIVAYGLAVWGSYICWQAESQDKLAKRAVEEYYKKMKKKELMMVEYSDKKQPLLNNSEDESDEDDEESSEDEEQNGKYKKLPKQLAIGN